MASTHTQKKKNTNDRVSHHDRHGKTPYGWGGKKKGVKVRGEILFKEERLLLTSLKFQEGVGRGEVSLSSERRRER